MNNVSPAFQIAVEIGLILPESYHLDFDEAF